MFSNVIILSFFMSNQSFKEKYLLYITLENIAGTPNLNILLANVACTPILHNIRKHRRHAYLFFK